MLTRPNKTKQQIDSQHVFTALQTMMNSNLKMSVFTKLRQEQKFGRENILNNHLLLIEHKSQFQLQQDMKVIHQQLLEIEENKATKTTQKLIFQLQIKNQFLNAQNKKLKQQLDESMKRQERENLKKKESLEMLAEELQEKNDLIEQLKRMIKKYEEGGAQCDILQDQLTQMKIAASGFEKIRSRLDYDIDRKNQKIAQLQKELTQLSQSFTQLQLRFQSKQESKERTKLVESQLQKQKMVFEKLTKELKSKVKRSQKQCESWLKLGNPLIAQMKLELVLNYLSSLCEQISIFDMDIFTSSEIQILVTHKQIIHNLQNHKQTIDNIDQPDFSQLILNGNRAIQDNILQAFDSPKSSQSEPEHVSETKSNIKANDNSGRFIQVESERRKLVDKIVDLKINNMKIRDIILKFLIKLNLMENKDEALSKDQLLTQILEHFQYSEDELKSVFRRKKKLFDFL